MQTYQSNKRRNSKQRFGEFTIILMPDTKSTPIQLRVHIVPVVFSVCAFLLITVGTVLMAANRYQSAPQEDSIHGNTEASLELVSAEIASLMHTAESFSRTIDRTIAQYSSQHSHSSASFSSSMNDIILSDNPEDLPRIAEQLDRARHSLNNIERLFSLNEQLLQHIPNAWPLPNNRGIVTMEYGPNIHPFTRQVYLHKGFDIAEPRPGAPILTIADGVVEKTGNAVDYGLHIWIRHRFGFRTLYSHLNSIRVSEGDQLKQGDMIGTLGSSGLSTGPHLHLELWMENQLLDPAPFLAINNDFQRRIRR